jgi:hypothetical protein
MNINLLINIIPLISYVKIVTNKWYSYLRVAVIRIDAHPAGEIDQHDTYPSHSSPRTSDICFLWIVPVCGNLWRVVDRFEWISLLSKKGSRHNRQHVYWPIRGSVPSLSPKSTNEEIDLSQASVDDNLLGLLSPYHQQAIGTFNTCSWEPTHRSLTDTGGGYNLGGADFPHTTPQFSQPVVSPFHLRAPPDLRLSIQQLSIELEKKTNPKSREWEPPLNFYHNLTSKRNTS